MINSRISLKDLVLASDKGLCMLMPSIFLFSGMYKKIYYFPTAGVTSGHKACGTTFNHSNLKQHKFIASRFSRSKSQMSFYGLKSGCRESSVPSGSARENPFLGLSWLLEPISSWLVSPFSIFEARIIAS